MSEFIKLAQTHELSENSWIIDVADINKDNVVIATKFGFKHQDGVGPLPAHGFDSRPEQ